jgi:hypothetical protein
MLIGRALRGERASHLGPLLDGLEHGTWEFRNNAGDLLKEVKFQNGRMMGPAGRPAPPILREQNGDDSAAMRDIRRSLDGATSIFFDRAPLNQAFDLIAELHDVPLRLDAAACRRAGISREQEITLNLSSGCTLRAALQIVAAEAGLAVVYRDSSLVAIPAGEAAWSK